MTATVLNKLRGLARLSRQQARAWYLCGTRSQTAVDIGFDKSLILLATPPGFEPGTLRLGSRESLNKFKGHSDFSRVVHGITLQSLRVEVRTSRLNDPCNQRCHLPCSPLPITQRACGTIELNKGRKAW